MTCVAFGNPFQRVCVIIEKFHPTFQLLIIILNLLIMDHYINVFITLSIIFSFVANVVMQFFKIGLRFLFHCKKCYRKVKSGISSKNIP